jgi:hypothetical protein
VSVPAWCSVDCKLGSLSVKLDFPQVVCILCVFCLLCLSLFVPLASSASLCLSCAHLACWPIWHLLSSWRVRTQVFACEVYASDAGFPQGPDYDDAKLNVGLRICRSLFRCCFCDTCVLMLACHRGTAVCCGACCACACCACALLCAVPSGRLHRALVAVCRLFGLPSLPCCLSNQPADSSALCHGGCGGRGAAADDALTSGLAVRMQTMAIEAQRRRERRGTVAFAARSGG